MARTRPETTDTAPGSSPRRPESDQDWPAQATDAIVTQVGRIRDKTTGPAATAARYAVYAAFAVSLGTLALLLLLVGLVRFINNYLPGGVWAAHTLIGSVLFLVGLGLFVVKARAGSAEA